MEDYLFYHNQSAVHRYQYIDTQQFVGAAPDTFTDVKK